MLPLQLQETGIILYSVAAAADRVLLQGDLSDYSETYCFFRNVYSLTLQHIAAGNHFTLHLFRSVRISYNILEDYLARIMISLEPIYLGIIWCSCLLLVIII